MREFYLSGSATVHIDSYTEGELEEVNWFELLSTERSSQKPVIEIIVDYLLGQLATNHITQDAISYDEENKTFNFSFMADEESVAFSPDEAEEWESGQRVGYCVSPEVTVKELIDVSVSTEA